MEKYINMQSNHPIKCERFKKELEETLGVIVTNVYYNEINNRCVIDFFDPYTYKNIKPLESGVVPYGWYISSVEYNPEDDNVSFNINKIPKEDTAEIYIPEECGKSDGSCRIHIYFDSNKQCRKVGFEGKCFDKKRFFDFYASYFRV